MMSLKVLYAVMLAAIAAANVQLPGKSPHQCLTPCSTAFELCACLAGFQRLSRCVTAMQQEGKRGAEVADHFLLADHCFNFERRWLSPSAGAA
jgi:hypothetical protein